MNYSDSNDNNSTRHPSGMTPGKTQTIVRTIFGLVMIVIYVGMGVLFLIDFFNWQPYDWGWTRYIVGTVLIIYGLWRGYRQFAGIDSRI